MEQQLNYKMNELETQIKGIYFMEEQNKIKMNAFEEKQEELDLKISQNIQNDFHEEGDTNNMEVIVEGIKEMESEFHSQLASL